MKFAIHVLRFLIGGLFIFSGLVKANDPLGLSYKMEEFFELWQMTAFVPFGLSLSVSMNALEMVAGAALWLGWKPNWTLRGLLALILFFTALTGYTYYTGYPKTCGCFGDCLPINASVSFYKDLVLLFGICLLMWKRSNIQPLLAPRIRQVLMLATLLFSIGLELYVLRHLPIVDCLPYRIGKNIPEQQKQPPPPPGSTVMFVYQKGGQEVEFSATQFPADFNAETYRFVRRYETGEIKQAPIQGFVLYGSGGADTTEAILASAHSYLIFSEQIQEDPATWGSAFVDLLTQAEQNSIPIFLITNRPDQWSVSMQARYPQLILLSADRTPIRTAARVNPTLYELQKGTIVGKWALTDWKHNP